MKAVIQRVQKAKVKSNNKIYGEIEAGFVVLLAVHKDDTEEKVKKMAEKIIGLRIFEDDNGLMNKSITDTKGSILLISQFTLYGDTSRGKRPSFINAARPETALPIYKAITKYIKDKGINIQNGNFGNFMELSLVNDGPTTIIIDI